MYLSPSWAFILGSFNLGFSFVFNHTVYMSIWHLHGKIPCGVQFCSYLWINNRIDHLNILHLHGLHLRELLKWLLLWLVNHTGYRNRIHPLGTLLKVLKTPLLPYIAESSSLMSVRPTFIKTNMTKCTHQLCEHRHHMQEYPWSHPPQT